MSFLVNEKGQATTEYILMLAISVTLIIVVSKNLVRPILNSLASELGQQIENRLFRNFHHFPVRGG